MFKRLRERIAEEATKFPVGQLANNSGKLSSESESKSTEANSTEDLITLSDSSSVVVPHTIPQQFSIGEDEDGSFSEQSTPHKQNASSGDAGTHHVSNSGGFGDGFGHEYRPSKKSAYVPQSDIESEREDPPTLNLDSISKDQLLSAIQTLKARSYKYKNKYAEVVKNFKELQEEKTKIENTLIENQDKGLRRIAELREQCTLEQKAKAHLEENLRLLLEEKDSRICVLETQINLLKEGGRSSSTKTLPEDCDNQLSDGGADTRSEDSATSMGSDVSLLQEKIERLHHQISQDKKTITAQKEQISLLRKQNENLSQELEEKINKLFSVENEQLKLKSEHESILKSMQEKSNELEKQQEENIMSMAETKRNMHEELELKEKQLVKAEEESKQYQAAADREKELVLELKKQHEEKVKELQRQLEMTEKTLEDEKQSLLQELAQGKTAAIILMQQECAKKIAAVEEEWKSRLESMLSSSGKTSQNQIEELTNSLKNSEEKLGKSEQQIKELDSLISELEKENASLKNSVEKLESELDQNRANYEKLKTDYSDYDSLKEKEKLLKLQESINRELNDKVMNHTNVENELKNVCQNLSHQLNEHKTLIVNLENDKSHLSEKIKALNREMIDKVMEYTNAENELKNLHESVSCELKEKKTFIANLESEKNCLVEKIEAYKISQKELEVACDNLKNEIISLKGDLKNRVSEIENIVAENKAKSGEIEQLQEELKKIGVDEKLASEKLNMSLAEMREFESENAELLLDNRLRNEEIQNIKSTLQNKDKELQTLKDSYSIAEKEVCLLNKTLVTKEALLDNAVIHFKQIESFVTSLENQQALMKLDLGKFQSICDILFQKFSFVSEGLKTISKNERKTRRFISDKLKNIPKENQTDVTILKSDPVADIESRKSEFESIHKESLSSETTKSNLESLDLQNLQEIISRLKSENSSLKEELNFCKSAAEMQDIEFAKNITMLQQSLSDLQEERNNLSLVLQNIESTQSDSKSHMTQDGSVTLAEQSDELDRCNWEFRITKLNSRVKLEIEALSSQTELVNKELKGLREQFTSSQESYSEKLVQLNSKLLSRTEALISLKEDLDVSIENANCLKELLEAANQELAEKNKQIISLENDCKNVRQECYKKECDLKEIHNSQLVDLKDQTKSTIEKLSEELNISNQLLKDKEEEFRKCSNKEKECELQIHDLTGQLENVLNCRTEINKLSDFANFFGVTFFDSISKLDEYSSKIASLNSIIGRFVSKLKEKDEMILQQNNSIISLQEEIMDHSELEKDFDHIRNELKVTSLLLEEANKELDSTMEKLNFQDSENSDLKTKLEDALQEIAKLSTTNISDSSKWQSLLDAANEELESLKLDHTKALTDLKVKGNELQEIEEKYNSSSNTVENLREQLNEQKIHLESQKSVTEELFCKYKSISSQIESMSAEFSQHLEKINSLLEEKETRVKTIDSKLSVISAKYESKLKEIEALEEKLTFCFKNLDDCKVLLKEKQQTLENSETVVQEWISKYENSMRNQDLLHSSKNDLNLELGKKASELNLVKSELEIARAEIEKMRLQVETVPCIQQNLYKCSADLQNSQKCLAEQLAKVAGIEKEKHELELKFNEKDLKLSALENEKQELSNEQDETVMKLESLIQELKLKYNKEIEKIKTLENEHVEKLKNLEDEKHNLELKCTELSEKLKVSESGGHKWEVEYNAHVEKLEYVEKEKHELILLQNQQIEKLTSMESEKLAIEQEINKITEKLQTLEKENFLLASKCSEKDAKLTALENQKMEQVEKLKISESERLDIEQKCNKLIEKWKILENEKDQFQQKFNQQAEKLEILENEKQLFIEKLAEIEKEKECLSVELKNKMGLLNALNDEKNEMKIKYDEQLAQIFSEIKVKDKKINSMASTDDLNKMKQKLDKQTETVKNLQSEMKKLSVCIAEKDDIIKQRENEKETVEVRHEENLKGVKDKLENAEKNYKTQVEEMKVKITQLEKENGNLISEKESLLSVQNQFKELKSGEEKVHLELKSKEEELKMLKEKLDTSNKEQVEKIHSFQESVKDKENTILKLKANIESISKEHKENIDELQKKTKRLEIEREQLMLQAQERVSATEAKCREDIKSLQEKCDKLLLENGEIEKLRNQLDESLLVAQSNQAIANQKISLLKEELADAQKKLEEAEKTKLISESELTNKLETLQQENKQLLHDSDHVERLKAEKEELNEKLKTVVQQVNKINVLQTERDSLKKENEKLSGEIDHLRTVENESSSNREKLKDLESAANEMKQKIEKLTSENKKLKSEISSLQDLFKIEKESLLLEKEKLSKQIEQLESCVSDPQSTSVQDYLENLKKEYDMALKAKDDEMLSKLKQLVRDFSIQMDVKDKDSEQMISELVAEKNQFIEEKLQKEFAVQMQTLREDLFEKQCALEEMRDSYHETIQEKEAKIKELELLIKSFSTKDHCATDSVHGPAEPSDWDDTWVVPDEVAENSSPNDNSKTCDEHIKEIESLQEELSKCNSEIKELKVLLRLSPPDTMVNNNNRRDSLQSVPEPTEFEYLKNIIYEYMMGKEPVTLAKVIAAVLRFNDVQTQQVIRREEARHPTTR